MTKHTRGPWEAKPAELDKDYIRVRGTVLGGEFKIANVPFLRDTYNGQAKAEANARLIAAAPELLKAVEVAHEFFINPGRFNPVDVERLYESAIRKATEFVNQPHEGMNGRRTRDSRTN